MTEGLLVAFLFLLLAAAGGYVFLQGFHRNRTEQVANERRYSVLESIPDGFFIVDKNFRFSHVNQQTETLLRKTANELIGRPVEEILDPLASELVPEIRAIRKHGIPMERLQYFRSNDRWVEIRIQPATDEVLVYLRDITERKRAEKLLRESERRFRLLLNQVPAILWTTDKQSNITSIGGAALASQLLNEEELLGRPFESIVDEGESPQTLDAMQRVLAGEAVRFESKRLDRWFQTHAEPLRDVYGDIIGTIGVALDITEIKETAEHLAKIARQDALTGLPNRFSLEERLPALLDEARGLNAHLAVLFIDLDRFKAINDTLGHRVGDELLRAVSRRLQKSVPRGDTIFRPGGDEFILVPGILAEGDTAGQIATRVLNALAKPFILEGRELFISASVGVSVFPENGDTSEELIKQADSAMYRAKESGRNNVQFYDGTMHARAVERLVLEQELREALPRNEFRLLYQPVVDVATRKVIGAEALVRWIHPRLGMVLPDQFIEIAEETGLIVDISNWILKTACAQAAQFRAAGAPDFRMAVNLSPRDFYEPDLVQKVVAALAYGGLPPEALDVEVAENIVLNEVAIKTLTEVRALGVGIVVNDFGIGYSSLGYMKRLPITGVKIDRSFIRDVVYNTYDQAIVKAVVAMAHTLEIRTIAEGAESQLQWEFVRSAACDQVQGFYFSGGLEVEQFFQTMRRGFPETRGSADNRVISLHSREYIPASE